MNWKGKGEMFRARSQRNMDERQWQERRHTFREKAAKAMAGLVGAVGRQDTSQPHAQKAAGTEF